MPFFPDLAETYQVDANGNFVDLRLIGHRPANVVTYQNGVLNAAGAAITVASAGAVSSVAGRTGAVVLSSTDLSDVSSLATSTQLTAAVNTAINALVNGAPGALNTLKELADAINDDASFAATVTSALAGKASTAALTAAVGAITASSLGLGSVNNTSDANKPVSTAQAAAIAAAKNAAIGYGHRAPYLGQVATGCYANDQFIASNPYFMSRSAHFMRANGVASFQIVLANYKGAEAATGAATFKASIEYPAGVFTPVTFGGIATASVASVALATSDAITLSIPKGALFWVRILGSVVGGFSYLGTSNYALGEGCEYGTSAQTDKTASGSVTYNYATVKPVAIIAQTTMPSVGIIGDSRCQGYKDTGDQTGDLGIVARPIGSVLPYLTVAQTGSDTVSYVGAHALRDVLIGYCSHVVVVYGGNDIVYGDALSTTQANLQAIGNYYPSKQCFIGTVAPVVSSTDSYATTANMTNTQNPTTLNEWIRTLPTPYVRHFEIADYFEGGRNTHKLLANGTANFATTDGTHETRAVLLQYVAANVLPAAAFS